MFNSKKNLEVLRKAFDVIAREEAKALPTPEECAYVTFSEEFEQKMQKLINKEKKPYYYLINTVGKRVACVIIALLLALTSITFGVKAIREAVIDFFVETFEKFSIVGFKDEDIPSSLDCIETYYAPTYIPEGYELKTENKMSNGYYLKFVSIKGSISFTQKVIDNIDMFLDTENAKVSEVTIDENNALYINDEINHSLYFNDNRYSYVITAEDDISKEELIKIAESLEMKQFVTLCRTVSFNYLKGTL